MTDEVEVTLQGVGALDEPTQWFAFCLRKEPEWASQPYEWKEEAMRCLEEHRCEEEHVEST